MSNLARELALKRLCLTGDTTKLSLVCSSKCEGMAHPASIGKDLDSGVPHGLGTRTTGLLKLCGQDMYLALSQSSAFSILLLTVLCTQRTD